MDIIIEERIKAHKKICDILDQTKIDIQNVLIELSETIYKYGYDEGYEIGYEDGREEEL